MPGAEDALHVGGDLLQDGDGVRGPPGLPVGGGEVVAGEKGVVLPGVEDAREPNTNFEPG